MNKVFRKLNCNNYVKLKIYLKGDVKLIGDNNACLYNN